MTASRASIDARWMARALALAARGLGRTHPNPPVGAVFVRGGRVLGEGYHHRAGEPHAEIEALRRVRGSMRGATLYVTLEPCAHTGRTPPCLDALLPLGLARVVVAMVDPNPRVRGRSIRRLRAAGVEVVVGVGGADAQRLAAGYVSLVREGRPAITLKLATSLDGRIATASGDARWITGPAARRAAHVLRDQHDAVLVGAETVRRDDPRLTCRVRGGRDPIRIVVVGAEVRLPARAALWQTSSGGPTWVCVPRGADAARCAGLARRGVSIVVVDAEHGRVAFGALARALGARGLSSVLIEGGGQIAAAAWRAGIVDRVAWFLAPRILGGDARPAIGSLGLSRVADAVALRNVTIAPYGDDWLLTADVRRGSTFASPRLRR